MELACSSEPAAPPTPDVPKYTDTQVLLALENHFRETTYDGSTEIEKYNCWILMKELEYAVVRDASDSNSFDVTGKFDDGITMTWVVKIDAGTSTYKHTGSGFVKTSTVQVIPTHRFST